MQVFWRNPAAWIGLALVALPVLVHLLARSRSRRMLFQSLRFVPTARVAALRRRVINDWPLLLVRVLVIAAAVAALAAPVVVSEARRAAWNGRVVRAIVLTHDAEAVEALAQEEADESFRSLRVTDLPPADALRAAADWLNQQPPAAREVVIIGDLREGALTASDFEVLASSVGVRFLPVASPDPAPVVGLGAVSDTGGESAARLHLAVQPTPTETRVAYSGAAAGPAPAVQLRVSLDQQAYADALLRAVWRNGMTFDAATDRAVTIAFDGAPEDELRTIDPPDRAWMQTTLAQSPLVRGGAFDGRLVVHAAMPVTDARAPELVALLLRSAFAPDLDVHEPRRIAAGTLAAWSRPAGSAPSDASPDDEGDRRWFWGAALFLLGLERLLRRGAHV